MRSFLRPRYLTGMNLIPYKDQYNPPDCSVRSRALRTAGRSGSRATLPFTGADVWTAYELSWLDPKGKPRVAMATFAVPVDSPNLIESKSFKLYLDSFNQTPVTSPEALREISSSKTSEAPAALL